MTNNKYKDTLTIDICFYHNFYDNKQYYLTLSNLFVSPQISVTDNQYEDSVVQMVGEGYEDDVTLDNIGSVFVPVDPEKEMGSMAEDDVGGGEIMLLSSIH